MIHTDYHFSYNTCWKTEEYRQDIAKVREYAPEGRTYLDDEYDAGDIL